MWWVDYKDYRTDSAQKKEKVEPGAGIYGCEMDEIQGWGLTYQKEKEKKGGMVKQWLKGWSSHK